MKQLIVIVSALVVFGGLAAEKKPDPFKAKNEARAAFNKQEGEVFRGGVRANGKHGFAICTESLKFDIMSKI